MTDNSDFAARSAEKRGRADRELQSVRVGLARAGARRARRHADFERRRPLARTNSIPGSPIAPDGTVSVFTSKVDLGTGTGTALGQIVAEELDVAISKIRMEIGDTEKSVDQGRTSASRTLERAGPQMRQAGAAARQELLKRASSNLDAPAEKLMVNDGVVSVAGRPEQSGYLCGARRRQSVSKPRSRPAASSGT